VCIAFVNMKRNFRFSRCGLIADIEKDEIDSIPQYIVFIAIPGIYSGCQKNVPIAERFFATTLMPPSFFRNINMTSGITKIIDFAIQSKL
jgi:hypothetical protein